MKFCQELGKLITETLQILHTKYGERAVSFLKVFERPHRFKDNWELFEDSPC
jgi:hypothetical protein